MFVGVVVWLAVWCTLLTFDVVVACCLLMIDAGCWSLVGWRWLPRSLSLVVCHCLWLEFIGSYLLIDLALLVVRLSVAILHCVACCMLDNVCCLLFLLGAWLCRVVVFVGVVEWPDTHS